MVDPAPARASPGITPAPRTATRELGHKETSNLDVSKAASEWLRTLP